MRHYFEVQSENVIFVVSVEGIWWSCGEVKGGTLVVGQGQQEMIFGVLFGGCWPMFHRDLIQRIFVSLGQWKLKNEKRNNDFWRR